MKIKQLSLALGAMLVGAVSSAQAVEDSVLKNIETRVGAIESKLIGWRRDIHQHPELSNQEVRTA